MSIKEHWTKRTVDKYKDKVNKWICNCTVVNGLVFQKMWKKRKKIYRSIHVFPCRSATYQWTPQGTDICRCLRWGYTIPWGRGWLHRGLRFLLPSPLLLRCPPVGGCTQMGQFRFQCSRERTDMCSNTATCLQVQPDNYNQAITTAHNLGNNVKLVRFSSRRDEPTAKK